MVGASVGVSVGVGLGVCVGVFVAVGSGVKVGGFTTASNVGVVSASGETLTVRLGVAVNMATGVLTPQFASTNIPSTNKTAPTSVTLLLSKKRRILMLSFLLPGLSLFSRALHSIAYI